MCGFQRDQMPLIQRSDLYHCGFLSSQCRSKWGVDVWSYSFLCCVTAPSITHRRNNCIDSLRNGINSRTTHLRGLPMNRLILSLILCLFANSTIFSQNKEPIANYQVLFSPDD